MLYTFFPMVHPVGSSFPFRQCTHAHTQIFSSLLLSQHLSYKFVILLLLVRNTRLQTVCNLNNPRQSETYICGFHNPWVKKTDMTDKRHPITFF